MALAFESEAFDKIVDASDVVGSLAQGALGFGGGILGLRAIAEHDICPHQPQPSFDVPAIVVQTIGKPRNALKNLILTDEDFRDIRELQPLVLTDDRLWNYETRFKGEETVDDVDCWVVQVRPRQILEGQRLFDGMVWIDKKEYNIVRMTGRAVPQIRTLKTENLFPSFTTIRKPIDGKHWFPVYTYADDTLQFRAGPQRERLKIEYSGYKRFRAESTLIVK